MTHRITTNASHQIYQPPLLTYTQRVMRFGKYWIYAEHEFAKEKPLKAWALLAASITSIALLIIPERVIAKTNSIIIRTLHSSVSYTLLSLLHMLRSPEINSRFRKFKALEFINQNRIENVENKEIILILKGEDDHNGALSHCPEEILLERYPLAMRKVSKLIEISQAIEDAVSRGNIIKGLFIHAHGSSENIYLGSYNKAIMAAKLEKFERIMTNRSLNDQERAECRQCFDQILSLWLHKENVDQLESSLQKLDPQALIILGSCQTAGVSNQGENIAQRIAKYANGRKVIAPAENTSSLAIMINPQTLQVKFLSTQSSDLGDTVKKIVGRLLFKMGLTKSLYFHEDITRVYQHQMIVSS
jgi:hypothetical protein